MNFYLGFLLVTLIAALIFIKKQGKRLRFAYRVNRKLNHEQDAVLSFLDRIGASVMDMTDLESTLNIVLDFIMDGTTARSGAIFLLDEKRKVLWCRSVSGPFPPSFDSTSYVATKAKYLQEAIKSTPVSLDQGILGKVVKDGETFIFNNTLKDQAGLGFSQEIESLIVEPLRIRQRTLGVIAILDKEVGAFDNDDGRFVNTLSGQVAVMIDTAKMYQERTQRERIERELSIARDIQGILIPQKLPQIDKFDLFFKSIPAREVGGDYYDIFPLREGKYGIVIADVCGKGVPGALVMTMLRSVLRTRALTSLSPGKVLSEVNTLIYDDMKRDMFVTVLYAILDPKNRKIVFARAGHNPLLVYQPETKKYQSYLPDGIALGLVRNLDQMGEFADAHIDLDKGDLVFFTTDGVEEAMNRLNETYGEERAKEIIKINYNSNSEKIITQVLSDLHNFARGAEQSDDITLGMIKAL